ncbi:MAG: hypothetical protein JNK87_30495 [Bryobacterales bacterium]|nr:hypothetical protein [Bryobacterales bacterium]
MPLVLASAGAMERHASVAAGELIVIGAFHPNRAMPWFDGWHISGGIEVREVLWGPASAQTTIQMTYVDPWSDLRSRWDSTYGPRAPKEIRQPGIFLLRRAASGLWQPVFQFLALGWQPLTQRDELAAQVRSKIHNR